MKRKQDGRGEATSAYASSLRSALSSGSGSRCCRGGRDGRGTGRVGKQVLFEEGDGLVEGLCPLWMWMWMWMWRARKVGKEEGRKRKRRTTEKNRKESGAMSMSVGANDLNVNVNVDEYVPPRMPP